MIQFPVKPKKTYFYPQSFNKEAFRLYYPRKLRTATTISQAALSSAGNFVPSWHSLWLLFSFKRFIITLDFAFPNIAPSLKFLKLIRLMNTSSSLSVFTLLRIAVFDKQPLASAE
jgi:hypothetical protein